MSGPVVFISVSRIVERDPDAFARALAQASRLIESTKPRTAVWAAYVDEARREVRIVHVFPDADAMSAHFEGSDERTNAAASLLAPVSYEVYGDAPAAALETLRREAQAAGGMVSVWPNAVAGFVRGSS